MKQTHTIIALIFTGTILLLHSCVTKYEPDIPLADKKQLVVEGLITDEIGPFKVRLTNTFDVDKLETFGDPVNTAQVQISDDQGNLYPLYYTTNGWYQTSDTLLQGVPGTTYDLNITTEDGTQFESTPVLMQNVPPIDSVYYQEVTKTGFKQDGTAVNENWLNILLDTHDPTIQTKYWKWDFEETWEVSMLTDSVLFHPAPDSGLPYFLINIKLADNVEKTCWVTHPSKTILIETTKDNPNDEINRFVVNSIPPKNERLHIKYSILIKQTALSPEMYRFWKKLKGSNEETGGIYEKVPEQIYANITCCNGKGNVLGYFSASQVKMKRIFIGRYDQPIETVGAYVGCAYVIPDPKSPLSQRWLYGTITASSKYPEFIGENVWTFSKFCSDCREYGSDKKPAFWK